MLVPRHSTQDSSPKKFRAVVGVLEHCGQRRRQRHAGGRFGELYTPHAPQYRARAVEAGTQDGHPRVSNREDVGRQRGGLVGVGGPR